MNDGRHSNADKKHYIVTHYWHADSSNSRSALDGRDTSSRLEFDFDNLDEASDKASALITSDALGILANHPEISDDEAWERAAMFTDIDLIADS